MDRSDRSELLFSELAQAGLLDISCKSPMMYMYASYSEVMQCFRVVSHE